ncbi:hypothetical protein B0G76_3666 [Paraburkholderia sp. BL23I1N1]|nr:hypothetical protein [Paraburkholderia sp. BL23I1N1]RKE37416.1 hypothetical protein B0G76_3666 [Paraburkholderia sp. BL23I1N1]
MSSSEEVTVYSMHAAVRRMDCGYMDRLSGSHNGGVTQNRKVKVIYGLH